MPTTNIHLEITITTKHRLGNIIISNNTCKLSVQISPFWGILCRCQNPEQTTGYSLVLHNTERGKKSRPGSVSLGKFGRGKNSFQWSSAETEGISLRSGQRLTVNSDVRTHRVWRGCALACERANERVGKRESGEEKKRAREKGGKGEEGGGREKWW